MRSSVHKSARHSYKYGRNTPVRELISTNAVERDGIEFSVFDETIESLVYRGFDKGT